MTDAALQVSGGKIQYSVKVVHVEKDKMKSNDIPCTKNSRWLNDFNMKQKNI